MPLRIEIWNPHDRDWESLGRLGPTDPPGSLSDEPRGGKRQLYLFFCAPDGHSSTLARSKTGFDVEMGEMRSVTLLDGLDLVAELHAGDSHEMKLSSIMFDGTMRVRFVHDAASGVETK